MGKGTESARYHPYAQSRSTNPDGNIVQPTPIRVPPHTILGYRSPVHGLSSKPLSSRRGNRTTEIDSFDPHSSYYDGMSSEPMQSIESVSNIGTDHAQGRKIAWQDTLCPPCLPCPLFPPINQISNGETPLALIIHPNPMDRVLPLPKNWMAYDEISSEQRRRLDLGPVITLNLADIATHRTYEQVQSLVHPRVCISPDGSIVDRFVTDCEKTSGRVFDRLFRRELHRISPFVNTSSYRPVSGQIFDVLLGDIRKRCLFDDLRDANARSEGELQVTSDERNIRYGAIPDYHFAESTD